METMFSWRLVNFLMITYLYGVRAYFETEASYFLLENVEYELDSNIQEWLTIKINFSGNCNLMFWIFSY